MKTKLFGLAVMTLVILSVSLGLTAVDNEDDSKISAMVTVPPQEFLVSAVGGDKVEVTTMVPEDGSPHSASLTPEKMRSVRGSQVYFKVGTPLPFELNNSSIFNKENPDMAVVDTSAGINLKALNEHYGHGVPETDGSSGKAVDPHAWLSPENLMTMGENIYAGLVELAPGSKEFFKDNLEALLERIAEAEKEIRGILGDYAERHFIVYHPAWGYFGDQFKLIQVAVEEKGKKPGPQKIREIADFAKEHGIRTLIASSQFDPSTARMVARTFRGEVSVVNPLSKDILDELVVLSEEIAGGYTD